MKEKNFARARQVLVDAIQKHPEAATDNQIRRHVVEAINEQIGEENRKIYLNNRPDTVAYFNRIYDLYVAALACDSVEQHNIQQKQSLGKKAKVQQRFYLGQTLLPYRTNLLGGGKFFYKKKDYASAFRFLHLYVQTKVSPIFVDSKGDSILNDPNDRTSVAVLAVLSAYASENPAQVLNYLPDALHDDELRPQLLEIGSKTAIQQGDTLLYAQLLQQGFDAYPDTEYFFMTLVRFYNNTLAYDCALKCSLRMTNLHPQRRDYWYMAGTEQQLLQLYDDALISYQKCVEIQADDAEAYASIGSIYLHRAHVAYTHFDLPRTHPDYVRQKATITKQYQQACTAYEQARKFAEGNTALWLSGLREAYFKLNRGKALKGLEKYK